MIMTIFSSLYLVGFQCKTLCIIHMPLNLSNSIQNLSSGHNTHKHRPYMSNLCKFGERGESFFAIANIFHLISIHRFTVLLFSHYFKYYHKEGVRNENIDILEGVGDCLIVFIFILNEN